MSENDDRLLRESEVKQADLALANDTLQEILVEREREVQKARRLLYSLPWGGVGYELPPEPPSIDIVLQPKKC